MSRVSVGHTRPGSLPPLNTPTTNSRPTSATNKQTSNGDSTISNAAIATDLGRTYDFEVRSGVGRLGGGGGGGTLAPVKGWNTLSQTPARDTADQARRRPGAAYDPAPSRTVVVGGKTLSHSASAGTLPSHLLTTADKLEFFLNWNKGWTGDEDDPSNSVVGGAGGGGAVVSGVLTPRTRYDRLAQSVSAVPFREEKELTSSSSSKGLTPLPFKRTLAHAASTPALGIGVGGIGGRGRTLGSSISQSTLHQHRQQQQHHRHHHHLQHDEDEDSSSTVFIPPSEFLNTIMPDSTGIAQAVAQENHRARLMADRFATLLQQRKLRKKLRRGGPLGSGSLNLGSGVAVGGVGLHGSDSDSDSPDELGAEDLTSVSTSHLLSPGGPKRKPGTLQGQSILAQIHSIVRTVTEDTVATKKARQQQQQQDDDDDGPRPGAKGAEAAKAATMNSAANLKAEVALQSVIQAYMETSGIAGSVAAGGASHAGSGAIKDREGNSTFTTAKITRDVKLVLDYLKSNPVLKGELFEKISKRTAERKARLKQQAETNPRLLESKVLKNASEAWSHHGPIQRVKLREEVRQREKDRQQRQQENKSRIDAYWSMKARERDAEIMHAFGPEMLARRARENAESDRLAHVAWGWIMMSQLIPITIRFKWKLKEILQARLTKQVKEFLIPTIRRSYVVNVTSKTNEARALALEKIKRVLVRYVIRWKWHKRRKACMNVWKFFILVKNAFGIRQGLKDSSLRSQIIKIQSWWRRMLQVIAAQNGLVELAWNARENFLIKSWSRKQKKVERARMGSSGGLGVGSSSTGGIPIRAKKPLPAHLLGGVHPRKRGGSGTDFTHTLANFNFNTNFHSRNGVDEEQIERDAQQGLAPKRIPRTQKREIIARFVKRRRAHFRHAVRNHVHVLQKWEDDHKHEIELRKARRELGLKGGAGASAGAASRSSHASAAPLESPLEPPHQPVLKLIPPKSELDHMIMAASKQYVLSKLRGAMNESQEQQAQANRPAELTNPLNFLAGNGSPTAALKKLTQGEQIKSKRELLTGGVSARGSGHGGNNTSRLDELADVDEDEIREEEEEEEDEGEPTGRE